MFMIYNIGDSVSSFRVLEVLVTGSSGARLSTTALLGWAQVNGFRGQTDTLEKMALRIQHDLWYIQNGSLWLDLKILLLTPK
jgi:putative colanic acid biosynthesis UDP-glucose lipid carrier transferase